MHRCRVAEKGLQLQRRCIGAGGVEQVQRCRAGAEVGAEVQVQRCRGAEVLV